MRFAITFAAGVMFLLNIILLYNYTTSFNSFMLCWFAQWLTLILMISAFEIKDIPDL